jgi:hypothetical protein
LLTILKMALSIGFRDSVSLLSTIQATRLLTLYLGGFISHCTHLPFLVAQPDVKVSLHPARALKNALLKNGDAA